MKKLLKVVLCLSAMLFSLTSCNGMHNRLYSNDQSIADDTMNDIIKYVNDEDINSLSQMFSKKALSSIDKYENKLKVFLAKLRCGIKKYELSAGPAGTGSSYYGDIIESIDVGYKIQTNDNNIYYIGFNKVFTSTNDKDLLGLYSIRLSEKNDDAFCCTEYNEYLIVTE